MQISDACRLQEQKYLEDALGQSKVKTLPFGTGG